MLKWVRNEISEDSIKKNKKKNFESKFQKKNENRPFLKKFWNLLSKFFFLFFLIESSEISFLNHFQHFLIYRYNDVIRISNKYIESMFSGVKIYVYGVKFQISQEWIFYGLK